MEGLFSGHLIKKLAVSKKPFAKTSGPVSVSGLHLFRLGNETNELVSTDENIH